MPRCFMAKKWKSYPWPDRGLPGSAAEDDEEIDVVGDTVPPPPAAATVIRYGRSCWGPASPTEGTTAPSPPPAPSPDGITSAYHGYGMHDLGLSALPFTPYLSPSSPSPTYATLQPSPPPDTAAQPRRCFTSTGAALSLPPKKKDIYRPYSLEPASTAPQLQPTLARPEPHRPVPQIARPIPVDASAVAAARQVAAAAAAAAAAYAMQMEPRPHGSPTLPHVNVSQAAADDLTAAHAILDLSASPLPAPAVQPPPSQPQPPHPHTLPAPPSAQPVTPVPPPVPPPVAQPVAQPMAQPQVPTHIPQQPSAPPTPSTPTATSKTVAYTYEAFFVSDGRSKRRSSTPAAAPGQPGPAPPVVPEESSADKKARYACGECGKRYATSSNLSRHKQTHRSLDSGSARQCVTCGKAYVSMPALAMHLLTHQLTHACGVCGKLFSRPWLLQGHLRSHTGEKPYGCAHCGKAFADRSNLRAHMQTHSQDKSFACRRCHKSFALKSYLNKHLESSCSRDAADGDADDASLSEAPPQCAMPA